MDMDEQQEHLQQSKGIILHQQQQNHNDMQCDSIQYPTTSTAAALNSTFGTNYAPPPSPASMNMESQMSTNFVESPIVGCINDPSSQQPQQQQQQLCQIAMPQKTTISTDIDLDVDSLLLQQFSCLGTTDHEDLINQFRTLLNYETTKDSAKFFLEMSNWNLQAALGSYLDYINSQHLPTMKKVLEAKPSTGQQAWRIRNEGNESWPTGCYIISPDQDKKIEVPALRVGECCDIIADIPPTHPTMSVWRLCTPYGTFFGDAIIMLGWNDTQMELSDRMSQLCADNANNTTNANSVALEVKVVKVTMD